MTDGTKLALWAAGAVTVVLLLEYVPRLGGGVLLLLVVYLAIQLQQRGAI